jgi:hypothetical protein
MTLDGYLQSIHLALIDSLVVDRYVVVRQRVTSQAGHLRVRITLSNGDFVESAEFFRLTAAGIVIADYRHQWMDASRSRLRKRWDSTPHHPEVPGFPYHCHDGSGDNVLPSEPLSIAQVLETISREIAL